MLGDRALASQIDIGPSASQAELLAQRGEVLLSEEYEQAGGYNFFGNATIPESNTQNGGKFQKFVKNSSIYWHSAVAGGHANQIGGLIRDAWGRVGWETGYLGYPITREFGVNGGRANHMVAGSIYYSATTGAKNVWLGIRDVWADSGWENGRFKFPTEDTRTTTCSVWAQDFQGGTVLYKDTGVGGYFLPNNDVDGQRLAYSTGGGFLYGAELQSAVNSWNQLSPITVAPVGVFEVADVFGTDHTLIRCDNAREVSYGTGCVNVYFTPIMYFWSSEFPNGTHNITLGQATTGAGLLPNNPLTRATPEQAAANRSFSCSPARIAALLPPKPDPSYQCDEYPFASSVQGGTENTRIMWVPGEEENRAHGEQVQSYQRVNRLMAGDYFFVRVL